MVRAYAHIPAQFLTYLGILYVINVSDTVTFRDLLGSRFHGLNVLRNDQRWTVPLVPALFIVPPCSGFPLS